MACPLQHSNIAFISPCSVQMVSPLRRFRVINIGSIVNTATHMNNSVEKAKSGIGNLGVTNGHHTFGSERWPLGTINKT